MSAESRSVIISALILSAFLFAGWFSTPGVQRQAEAKLARFIVVQRAGSGWLVFDQYEGGVAFVPSSAGWDGKVR